MGSNLSPQTQQLLNIASTLQKQIRAEGKTPVVGGNLSNANTLAKLLGSYAPTDTVVAQNAVNEIGRGETTEAQLPLDVRSLVESTQGIKDSTGTVHHSFLSKIGSGIEHIGGDALSRVSDLLSRGQYAVASGVKDAYDEAVSHGSNTPEGALKDIIYGAKGFGEGAAKGIAGKDKESFNDYIQHVADTIHYKNQGDTGSESITKANANPGVAHVNPVLKAGLGLAGDIFLDPTTYIGAGAVGKVLKGAKYIKGAELGSKVATDAEKLGVSTAPEFEQALGMHSFPSTKKFIAKTGPTAKELSDIRNKGLPTLKNYAKQASNVTWEDQLTKSRKVIPLRFGMGKATGLPDLSKWISGNDKVKSLVGYTKFMQNKDPKLFSPELRKYLESTTVKNKTLWGDRVLNTSGFKQYHDLQSVADKAELERQIEKHAREALGNSREGIEKTALNHLIDIQHRMTAPDIRREFGVSFAGKHLGSVSVERLARKSEELQAGDGAMSKALKGFQKTFYNSAGIRKDIKGYAAAERGSTAWFQRRSLHKIVDAFGETDNNTRKRVAENFLSDTHTPVLNSKSEDLSKVFRDTVERTQEGIKPLTQDFTGAEELKAHLPTKFQKAFKLDNITETVKQGKKSVQVLKENWLEPIVKEWLKDPDKDINNPSHIMYWLDHSYLAAHGNASMWQTIGHLGMNLRQAEKVAGNSKPLVDEAVRHYAGRGFKEATFMRGTKAVKIPYLQGTVFDDDTRKSIERLYGLIHSKDPYSGMSMNDIVKLYDKALRYTKTGMTKYNPAYYARNLYGEVLAGYFGGVSNPLRYKQATEVLRGRDLAGEVQRVKSGIVLTRKVGNKTQTFTRDQLMHLYAKVAGLKTGFIHEDLDIGLDASQRHLSKILGGVNNKVQSGAERVEDVPRMAHFIDALSKDHKTVDIYEAARKAGDEVRKYHFDFADYTPTEKALLSRIYPFYKWTRKNIPLMLEMTLTHPGKVLTPLKTLHAASIAAGYEDNGQRIPAGDLVVPDWLRKDGAVPVGQSGHNTIYIDPPIPWMQAWEGLQSPIQTQGLMQNPLFDLKSIIETGKLPSGEPGHGNEAVVNTFPQLNFIRNLITHGSQGKSNLVNLAQFLSGIGLQENTENRQYAQAKQDQQNAINNRLKYKNQTGESVSTRHPGVF